MTLPIDVDDPSTWPAVVYETASEWAYSCVGLATSTLDLPLPLEWDEVFRRLLVGHRVRAYHYTNLLPHEKNLILRDGLRPLSAELLSDRIDAAYEAGVFSCGEAEVLKRTHVFARGGQQYRESKVCLVLSKNHRERNLEDCLPLLTTWGGEGIYRFAEAEPILDQLQRLGTPTVVSALVEINDGVLKMSIFPSLHKAFVASLLGLEDVSAEVHYPAPIPPASIEHIEEVDLS